MCNRKVVSYKVEIILFDTAFNTKKVWMYNVHKYLE